MAPKTPEKDAKAKVEASNDVLASVNNDLDEIDLVNNSLDSLNSALDAIEQRADSMRSQLLELLMSNREILKELQEEYKPGSGNSPDGGSTSNGSA
uniref:Uncharacterized protein n=1 Tax=Phlebotomus kandelakii TaxID=1109342 RepID=A0A6B2EL37_9DIPT